MCEAMLSPEVVEPTLKMMDDGFHFLVEENDDVHMLGNQDVPELMNICTQRTTSDLLMMIEVPDLCEDALSIVSDWTTSSSLEESDENDSGLDIDLESSGFTSAHSFAMTQQQRKQDDTTTTPSVLANDPPSTPPTPVETTDTKKKYTITKTTKSGRTVKSTLKLQQQQQEQTQPKPKTIKVTTTKKSKPAGKKSQNTATTKKTTTTPPSSSNTSKNSKISATRLARLERNKLAARESRRRKKVHVDKLTALIESIEKRCTANDKRIADMLRMKDQLQAKFNAQQQRLIMA